MTSFAIGIWIFEQTGRSTSLALTGVFALVPTLVVTLFSGVIVDRSSRKRLMILGDSVAGLSTISLMLLFLSGNLEIWHLYVANAINMPFDSLQGLAYRSSLSTMVSKEQYGRVSGMTTLTWYGGNILSPVLAALVYQSSGLFGVFLVDVVTFVVAVATVGFSPVPQPRSEPTSQTVPIRRQLADGFRYIWDRPPLRALLVIACLWSLFHDATPDVAMVLGRTGNDETALAAVSAASGVGGVIAALLVSALGLPRRRMITYGVSMVAAGLGKSAFGFGRSVSAWVPTQGYTSANFPLLLSAQQSIVMAKVDPAFQGRYFAAFRVVLGSVSLIAQSLKGPIGDFILEPAMADGGLLAPYLGSVFGTGVGAGFALQYSILGFGMVGVGVFSLAWRRVRDIESTLPDHDQYSGDV